MKIQIQANWKSLNQNKEESFNEEPITSKYEVVCLPTPCGFPNIGNTCYQNASLQCIMATNQLLKCEFKNNPSSEFKGKASKAIYSIVNAIIKGNVKEKHMEAVKAAACMVNPQFEGNDQQDANEFFSAIVEGLSQDLNTAKGGALIMKGSTIKEESDYWWGKSKAAEDSIICDMFKGQLVNKIYCEKCEHNIYDFEDFTCLQLEIPDNCNKTNIEDCIRFTMKVNYFDEESGFSCSICSKKIISLN